MKTKNILILGLLALSMLPILQIRAQVTIGSTLPPRKGALLDIKGNIASDPLNLTDSTAARGLLLPRVELVDINLLTPMLTPAGAANTDSMKLHTGLTVYNMTENDVFSSGLYVWTGTAWMKMGVPEISKIRNADSESNSFIIDSTSGVDVPIIKAYKFWEEYSSPPFAAYPFTNVTLSQNDADISAELIWMDQNGLIDNVGNNNELPIVGNGKNSRIRIFPVIGSTVSGNAVIAVRIKGPDGPDPSDPTKERIRWSWHIWFTDYDPNRDVSDNIVSVTSYGQTPVKNGAVYRYNNTSHPDGNFVFMDRDLGAYNATVSDNQSNGCYYQWGRKDPFPGAELQTKRLRSTYDKIHGNTPLVEGNNSRIVKKAVPSTSDGDNNLANSVMNPYVYYSTTGSALGVGGGNSINDWYTNRGQVSGKWLNYVNDFLWDENGSKTIFDPCPKGWRVPAFKNDRSPWFFQQALVTAADLGSVKDYTNYVTAQYIPLKGFVFTNDYEIGYYSFNGYRTGGIGDTNIHEGVSQNGGRWVATGAENEYTVYGFSITSPGGGRVAGVNPEDSPSKRRATGFGVRCVQE